MIGYNAIFPALLEKASIKRSTLDKRLKDLIVKFERVLAAVKLKDRPGLLSVLAQVDAIICVGLYRMYDVSPDLPGHTADSDTKVNKVKAMALKAKALQLKWKTK